MRLPKIALALSAFCFMSLAHAANTTPPVTVSPTVVGGQYNTAAPSALNKQFLPVQLDANGNLKVNVVVGGGGGGGGSVTQGTTPWVDNVTQWNSVALGSPSNYGTSPGAVPVIGVNAAVTNALPAGTNVIGKFGIDQTTLGTTNGVTLVPSTASTAGISYSSSGGTATNSRTLKSGAGNLFSLEVSVGSTVSSAAWAVFIFDATSATGTIAKCYNMPSGTVTFTANWTNPVRFGTGVTVGVSTAVCNSTYTAPGTAAAFISGEAL
jgi:hypothetical protein